MSENLHQMRLAPKSSHLPVFSNSRRINSWKYQDPTGFLEELFLGFSSQFAVRTTHCRTSADSVVEAAGLGNDVECWCEQSLYMSCLHMAPRPATSGYPGLVLHHLEREQGGQKRAKRTSNRWRAAFQNLKERRDTLRNDAI